MRKTVSSTADVLEVWRESKIYQYIKAHDETDAPTAYLDTRTVCVWRNRTRAAIAFGLEVAFRKLDRGELRTWGDVWRYGAGAMRNYDESERQTAEELGAAIQAERCVVDIMFEGRQ